MVGRLLFGLAFGSTRLRKSDPDHGEHDRHCKHEDLVPPELVSKDWCGDDERRHVLVQHRVPKRQRNSVVGGADDALA